MISIRMGNKSILKAKAAPSLPDGTYVDLFHDVEIKSDLTLAAMFGTEDVEFVHSERSAWLTVSNGEGPRQLQIGIYEDGDRSLHYFFRHPITLPS